MMPFKYKYTGRLKLKGGKRTAMQKRANTNHDKAGVTVLS